MTDEEVFNFFSNTQILCETIYENRPKYSEEIIKLRQKILNSH